MGMDLDSNSWLTSLVNYSRASSDHTVMYWLRMDSTSGTRRPAGNTGGWEARCAGTTLTSDYLQSGTLNTVTLVLNQLHHVAFVQDVGNGDRFGYLDGVAVSTILTASFPGAQNGLLRIGVAPGGATQGWNGVIEDFRVYDRVMTQAEIQTIFACKGTDGFTQDIDLRFRMNEGVDAAAVASLINQTEVAPANTPTVTGSPVYNYDAGVKYRRCA